MHLERHVVARILGVPRERLPLDAAEVDDRADLRVPAASIEPTTSAGSGRRCVSETTSDGAPSGRRSIRDAVDAVARATKS